MSRTILVAVDGSDACHKAFDWLLGNFFNPGDEITLIHGYEIQHSSTMAFISNSFSEGLRFLNHFISFHFFPFKLKNKYKFINSSTKINLEKMKETLAKVEQKLHDDGEALLKDYAQQLQDKGV